MLKNKKVGIWGFGIVGQSVLKYLQPETSLISIMDTKDRPDDLASNIAWIKQTDQTILDFLNNHDYIIPSPGIILEKYQPWTDKFVHELDLFAAHNHNKTIAITGTVGKTTITSFIAQCLPHTIAAGNIGHAMLETLDQKNKTIVLELSSYQLQFAQNFTADLAIWSNFFPNHLDHHTSEQEYFQAKCQILKNQNSKQIALLPAQLWEKITETYKPKAQSFLFSTTDFTSLSTQDLPIFFFKNNDLVLRKNNQESILFSSIDQLPKITFLENWLIILATLFLNNVSQAAIMQAIQNLQPEPHRMELIATLQGVACYNDSKSTIWQSTKHAIDQFPQKKIALLIGGISKGIDRKPLFAALENKPVTVFLFGKERDDLQKMCLEHNVACIAVETLSDAVKNCFENIKNFEIILFSPAGASFDQFQNFAHRGNEFKKLIHAYTKPST